MNAIKSATRSTKNFVVRHRTPIAVLTTMIIMGQAAKKGLEQHDAFLRDHGLYEEFHTDAK